LRNEYEMNTNTSDGESMFFDQRSNLVPVLDCVRFNHRQGPVESRRTPASGRSKKCVGADVTRCISTWHSAVTSRLMSTTMRLFRRWTHRHFPASTIAFFVSLTILQFGLDIKSLENPVVVNGVLQFVLIDSSSLRLLQDPMPSSIVEGLLRVAEAVT